MRQSMLAFAVLFTLLSALTSAINWWVMALNSSVAVVVLLASGIGAAGMFVKQVGRQPNRAERHWLALWCTVVAYVASVFIFFMLAWLAMSAAEWQVLREQLVGLSPLMMIAVFALMSIVYYAMLCFAFGWLSRKCYHPR